MDSEHSSDDIRHVVKLAEAQFPGLHIGGGRWIALLCHEDGSITWEVRDYNGTVLENPLTARNDGKV